MRTKTIEKYVNGINQLRHMTMVNKSDFNKVSRELFGNFVTMHYFLNLGVLESLGEGMYSISPNISTADIIDKYAKLQNAIGKRSCQKHRARMKADRSNCNPEIINKANNKIFETKESNHTPMYHVEALRSMGFNVVCTRTETL